MLLLLSKIVARLCRATLLVNSTKLLPWKTTRPLELQSSTTSITSAPSPLLSCNPGRKFWKLRSSNTFYPAHQKAGSGGGAENGTLAVLACEGGTLCMYHTKSHKAFNTDEAKPKNRLFYSCFIILG